jgi:hypothetical protein
MRVAVGEGGAWVGGIYIGGCVPRLGGAAGCNPLQADIAPGRNSTHPSAMIANLNGFGPIFMLEIVFN